MKHSVIHRYRFPEQPHEIKVGDSPKNPDTAESDELKRGFCGTLVGLDETAGTIQPETRAQLARAVPNGGGAARQRPEQGVAGSLTRLAEAVVAGGFAADSPVRAPFDLLGCVPPRIEVPASPLNALGFADQEDLVAHGEVPLATVRRIAQRLDRSVLPVQGPPGSGKTYRSPDDPRPARQRETGRRDRQQPQR